MWFVTWVGGMAISAALLQIFCAVLWAVSQAVSGYEFNGDSKVSLHMGMFVIGIVGYLFFSLGWYIYSAPVGG